MVIQRVKTTMVAIFADVMKKKAYLVQYARLKMFITVKTLMSAMLSLVPAQSQVFIFSIGLLNALHNVLIWKLVSEFTVFEQTWWF